MEINEKEETNTWVAFLEKRVENSKKNEKDKTLQDCFVDIIKNIPACQRATHVGKFPNPAVKAIGLYQSYHSSGNGYVLTQNTKCEPDICFDDAKKMPAWGFLSTTTISNPSQNILEAVESDDKQFGEELQKYAISKFMLQQAVIEMRRHWTEIPVKTDTHLKQVYFPIDNQEYHLLTILSASSLLFELKKRIQAMNVYEEASQVYKKIKRLTILEFGSGKPRNISVLSNREKGKAYLLESMPPTLQPRDLVYPKRDYFREVVWYKRKTETFYALDYYLKLDRNNKNIRNKIADITADLLDYVMDGVYALRSGPSHWSDEEKYERLNLAQKIWLDEGYREERKETEWAVHIGAQFARWVISSYEKLMQKEKVKLGDAEFQYFQNKMEQLLKEEVRYRL